MLPIYICEDKPILLQQYQKMVSNIILIEEFDMQIQAAVLTPDELLQAAEQYKSEHENMGGFYLLDIDLNAKMDGFDLAQEIRSFDPRCFIVFITTHSEMAMLTFRYQIEAMDFILKDESWEIGERLHACLDAAMTRQNQYVETAKLVFKIGSHTTQVEQEDILYLTSSASPHKVQLIMKNGVQEFYSTLNECQQSLNKYFIRCHKAFIVNTSHIIQVNRRALTITLSNGESIIASTRGINRVISFLRSTDGEICKINGILL